MEQKADRPRDTVDKADPGEWAVAREDEQGTKGSLRTTEDSVETP